MDHFTIRDIENLSGIKAHTLRIWEQRYSLMTPKRKVSNHRFYDSDDLKHILRISYLYHKGIKISRIAAMEENAIIDLLSKSNAENSNEYLLKELMEASIDFDEERFERGLDTLLLSENFEEGVVNVLYPYLEKIGLLWLTDHIIPAQEHFTSNIIMRKIIAAIDALKDTSTESARNILLFTPTNEHHEIALLFIHYLLKKNGQKVIYFGANVPLDDIEQYVQAKTVDSLHFHVITHLNPIDLKQYVVTLAKKFPRQQIIVSGPGFKDIHTDENNVRMLKSMKDLIHYAKEQNTVSY